MGEALAALYRRCEQRALPRLLSAGRRDERHRSGGRRTRRPGPRHRRRLLRRRKPVAGRPAQRNPGVTTGVRLVLARHGRSTANAAPRPRQPPAGRAARRRGPHPGPAPRRPAGRLAAAEGVRLPRAAGPADRRPGGRGARPGGAGGRRRARGVLGDLEGRSDTDALAVLDEVWTAWWRGDLAARMPGGESALEVRTRFLPALDTLVDGVSDGDVLLVSHGAAIRMAAGRCWARPWRRSTCPTPGSSCCAATGRAGYWSRGTRPRRSPVTSPEAARRSGPARTRHSRAHLSRRSR